MEESNVHYSLPEYLFNWVGLILFLLDISLDIFTVVSFYLDGAYVYMAVMIFLLVGSSVLLQVFSWLWYSDYQDENLESKVEEFAKKHSLIKPLHFLQLGVYLRYAGVMEISTTHFFQQTKSIRDGVAVQMNKDFQMLRLFEAFSESAPQLLLMIYITLQRRELELITGLKIVTSAAAIASSEAFYHRSMRAFLHDNCKMSWISTVIYFLWNLLLIIPRISALALFYSVLPCYIIAHFLSLWMLLVLVVWSQKTNHMEGSGWEWLFRATIGLIWYFSWFNVSTGSMKLKTILYNVFMGLDTVMLLGFWCWKVFEYSGCWSSLNPYVVIPTLLGLYAGGIAVKIIYYTWFRPKCDEEKVPKPSQHQKVRHDPALYRIETDSSSESTDSVPDQTATGVVKRGRNMAANFFY